MMDRLRTTAGLTKVIKNLNDRTGSFRSFQIKDSTISFLLCDKRQQFEMELIKAQGIKVIVSLTEQQHQAPLLADHFETFHIPIPDLCAPKVEQAKTLLEILKDAYKTNRPVAVHCLAGIGRTSTMLLAAHLLKGEDREFLLSKIKKRNPSFVLTPSQKEFIDSVSQGK